MEFVTLNNGLSMPIIGLGTWALPNENLIQIVKKAYGIGYTKFDTAWKYKNESVLGEAFQELDCDRKNLFITTKLHELQLYYGGRFKRFHIRKSSVVKAVKEALKNLKIDYLDLYLIHWPFPGYVNMYEDMVECYKEGLVKSIGVSSFTEIQLDEIYKKTKVMPAVNQFEISPYNTRKDLIKACNDRNIIIEAYSQFGGKWIASSELMNNPVLVKIAINYNKSVAQIILRWLLQQGVCVIPRSQNEARQSENIDVFDFVLSNDDMNHIDNLNRESYVWGKPGDVD